MKTKRVFLAAAFGLAMVASGTQLEQEACRLPRPSKLRFLPWMYLSESQLQLHRAERLGA